MLNFSVHLKFIDMVDRGLEFWGCVCLNRARLQKKAKFKFKNEL